MEMALGILAAAAGGVAMGSCIWPMKLIRNFQSVLIMSNLFAMCWGVANVLFAVCVVLLGAIGAFVGAGIQQAMQMIGGQGLGFISGEWRGVYGKPQRQMYLAVAALIIATIIMAYGNALAS